MRRIARFPGDRLGKRYGIKNVCVGRVQLLPAGRVTSEHGDRDLRHGSLMKSLQAARIEDAFYRIADGTDAGSRELIAFRDIHDLAYYACTFRRPHGSS